jgi:hypothetical protein
MYSITLEILLHAFLICPASSTSALLPHNPCFVSERFISENVMTATGLQIQIEVSKYVCVGWQVVTQVSLILLLFGTVIGDLALLADVGQRALRRLSPSPPALLVDHDGRGIMVVLTLCVVLPLCLLRK